jgi:hypothetical protein
MTEVTVLFADPIIPWYPTAVSRTGYLWCVQDGVIVGGSQDDPSPVDPLYTGNIVNDLATWIQDSLTAMMVSGPAPDPTYHYPTALSFANSWGIQAIGSGNGFKDRPFVALAYTDDFQFGDLNIPQNLDGKHPRQWFFKITGFGTPDSLSPAYNTITTLSNESNPIFKVLELQQG